ncbi:MAG: hypothetical protein EOO38_22565, partial [Cytophagaceae bacterium]
MIRSALSVSFTVVIVSFVITPVGIILGQAASFPNAENTGPVPGTVFQVLHGNQTFTKDNQVIANLDVHGKVIINADNVTLRNSIVRGPPAGPCI